MPTTAERHALVFIAALAVVGAGVRVANARRFAQEVNRSAGIVSTDSGTPAARALAAQIAAVDSARSASKRGARRSTSKTGSGSGTARRRRSSERDDRSTPVEGSGRPDDELRSSRPSRSEGGERPPPISPDNPIDINTTTAAQLELLPRVGPALARQIVAWRDAHGPFLSTDDLRHVPGIGVTTAARLGPLVTFSAGSRPFQSEARPSRHYPDLPAI